MNIHEYQAKELLRQYSIPVPEFRCTTNPDEAVTLASELNCDRWVIKAQVHAGGRGKAGGVKLIDNLTELKTISSSLLENRLITKQSAPDGQPVNTILIQAAESIAKEYYLGMLIDRSKRRLSIIASSQGGMDIETVAKENPEAIASITIDPVNGLLNYQVRSILRTLELDKHHLPELTQILNDCYRLFLEKDLSMLEINPFILTKDDQLRALDAKISIDDNALFRHPELKNYYDSTQNDPKEHIAKENDLNYIALSGNIACMVNGAGLAMATMDIIQLHGGSPANFLDVGGNTNKEKVAEAFKLILSDNNVKAILVNIFGGIVRCDVIAEGIIDAVSTIKVSIPIIVRLEGTNVEQGKKLLADCTLNLISADDLDDAAIKAVKAASNNI